MLKINIAQPDRTILSFCPATSDDLADIVKLERYLFAPEIAFGHARWRELLRAGRCETWLLRDREGALMAYLSVLPHRGWRRLVVQTLAVHWKVRRQGWARWLLGEVIRRSHAEGWGGVRLEVSERNEEGLALYDALGFRIMTHLPDYYGPGHHGQRRVLAP